MPRYATQIFSALAGLLLASSASAAPAMWEVRDADSAIWVFGSFHVLPEGLTWRTPLFEETLAAADKIVFEADVGPDAMADIGAKGFARGIYTDGTLLTDIIDDDTEAKLRALTSTVNVPVGSILAMKPWFAANTLSVLAMSEHGFTAEGVEFVLQPEIAAPKQGFLETGDQQLDVLSGAPEAEQVAMLESILDEISSMPKVLDKMIMNWSRGTPDRLGEVFLSEASAYGDAFLERLIYARNRNWIPALEAMLADNQENLVIVGAAHLIGDDSVLDLLEQAGYTVTRIQ